MNSFGIYFEMGYEHIANLKGIDHILFIASLIARYQFADWRKILVLVTSFTIGHTITLALSVLNLVNYSVVWIEFLIPVTIAITAFSNLFIKKFIFKSRFPLIYFFALFFGLIHGLGFSNYLKGILGSDTNILMELFAFGLGLEAGQLLIVLAVLLISFIFVSVFKCNRREYLLCFGSAILALSLQMAIDRFQPIINH